MALHVDRGFFFGPAGWAYDDWKGIVYPRPQKKGFHPLPFLARYVNLVEVNATFYAPLRRAVAEGWLRRIEDVPGFRFVIKAWRRFTHEEGLPVPEDVAAWTAVLEPLSEAGRLLGVLVQFPYAARHDPWVRQRLLDVRALLPAGIPLATEFRHRSWSEPEALRFLEREGFSFVNIDQPQIGDCLPPMEVVTGPLAYARLHGRNARQWFSKSAGRDARYDYHYGPREIAGWVGRVERLKERNPLTLVVGNNHYQGQAMAAVLAIAHEVTGRELPVPETMLERFPELEAVRRPEPGDLF